ncbi:MAG: peptide deformylase [Cyanobacteria bacterium]|nr:peptide deformylase [Cyanobacteriota bacterium]
MTVKKIRKIGDPVLREKCKTVDSIDNNVIKLVKDMIDTLTNDEVAGIGLAAPQIGILKRIIIVNFNDKIEAFINPVIEIIDDEKITEEEGCLSIYSIKTSVKRSKKIKLTARDLKNMEIELEAEGMLARIFQHEVDHLNGILFIDHLSPKEREDFLTKVNGEFNI